MNIQDLHRASKAILLRDAGKNMIGATISWDAKDSKVTLAYYFDHPPTDGDIEQGELALAELVVEFGDIALGDSEYTHFQGSEVKLRDMDGLIYFRP